MIDDLLNAYLNTDYVVDGFVNPIRVGEVSVEADELLLKHGQSEWALITAFNPMSFALDNESNLHRNQQLLEKLSDFVVIHGVGQDKNGIWPPETSFFVIGITLDQAIPLAQLFGQLAIVYGSLHEPARLIQTLGL
jgi:hypothetical protein